MVPMYAAMLRSDRQRRGFTIGQVAWRLGVTPARYRELEAGTVFPNFDTWDRMCKLYGPQSFMGETS
jgi:transcriptional regulator with XRE-family HTH domain